MTEFFLFSCYILLEVLIWKVKNFSRSDFPSPRFSRLKNVKFDFGWVKNHVKRETGDSWVVTCHREHINNKLKRSERL